MELSRKDVIAGHPAKMIRQFLRHLSHAEGAGVQFAAYYLKLDEATADTVLSKLLEEGLIEPYKRVRSNEPGWRNTIKGNRFGQGKFLKPISRDEATIILNNFLLRVSRLNADPYFFIGVNRIEVFGSYLSEAALVNDIDLFIHYGLKPSFRPSDQMQLSQDRIKLAELNGRQFRNIVDETSWPTREVELYVRARERRLSLHRPSDGIFEEVEKKAIFSESWS